MKPIYLEKYPHIFQPLSVGRKGREVTFKNRLMVSALEAPIGCDFNGRLTDYGIDFYADFIKGGYAAYAVTFEIPQNTGHPRSLVISDETTIGFADCHRLTRLTHAYNGVGIVEITHPGFCMIPAPGRTIMSASEMIWNGNPVKQMDYHDMEETVRIFTEAAVGIMRGGFDVIQLNYCAGWLVSQFLSPLTNHRTDEFGGSVENRCRFPRMIIESIREATDDMPIELRLNAFDGLYEPDGIQPEDAAQQALIFEDAGVSMIHMSNGHRLDTSTRPEGVVSHFLPNAINLPGAIACKAAGVKIPVGISGKVDDPLMIETILAEGSADYVLMTRQAIADPDFANKIKEDRIEDIRPCLHCNYCSDAGRRSAKTTKDITFSATSTFNAECSVNPFYGQGYWKKKIPAPSRSKKVIVVGGGAAGMSAAVTAAKRGHQVVLFEQSDKLGGLLSFADHMWFKDRVKDYREYLIRQIEKAGVDVRLNQQASLEHIEELSPDAVLVAVGGAAIVPDIAGVDNDHVMLAMEAIKHQEALGNRVVIIGGGLVGCELSICLAEKGKEVTVIEMSDALASNGQLSERVHTLKWMEKNKVNALTETKCTAITPNGVYVEGQNGQTFIEADSVVLSVGYKPLKQQRDTFLGCAFDVINIGDCKAAGTIRQAVTNGFDAAMIL